MKTFRTMLKTEIKLSVRGMDMVIFGLCLPVAMVVILGAVSGNRPAFEGASYTFFEQSFGALSTIAICAGGVMGLPLLISDYRQKKILKRFQVTPVSPALILAVHVAIYAIYALGSLVLVYGTSAVFFGSGCRVLPRLSSSAICWSCCPCSASAWQQADLRRIPRQPESLPVYFIFPCLYFPAQRCPMKSCPSPCRRLPA